MRSDIDKKDIQKNYVKRGTKKNATRFFGVLSELLFQKKILKRTQKEKEEIRISKYEST